MILDKKINNHIILFFWINYYYYFGRTSHTLIYIYREEHVLSRTRHKKKWILLYFGLKITNQTLNPFFQQNHDAVDNKSKNPSAAIIDLSDEFIYVTWPNLTCESIFNGFFKANYREKTPQKSTPTVSLSPFFRLKLLQ